MTAPLRCRLAAGLSVLVLTGALSPVSVSAAPAPSPLPTDSTTPAASAGPSTSAPSNSVSYQPDNQNYSLTVSPTRLAIGQGDIGTRQKITLINRGLQALDVQVHKRNFAPNTDGSLTYDDDAPYAASAWVTVSPKQLVLAPGEAQVVTADVRAPQAYEPGDHQVALVFLVPAGETTENVRINRGVGMPVYITAPGRVERSVRLSDLTAPRFVRRGPVELTATVHNDGTVHQDFRAPSPLTVQAAGTPKPFPDFTVPRNSVRNISTSWDPPFLCLCRATVKMTADTGAEESHTVRVIVFPWDLLAALVGAVLLVVFGVVSLRRRYRASVAKTAAAMRQSDGSGDG